MQYYAYFIAPVAWLVAPALGTVSAATPTLLASKPLRVTQTCTCEAFSETSMVRGVRLITGTVNQTKKNVYVRHL